MVDVIEYAARFIGLAIICAGALAVSVGAVYGLVAYAVRRLAAPVVFVRFLLWRRGELCRVDDARVLRLQAERERWQRRYADACDAAAKVHDRLGRLNSDLRRDDPWHFVPTVRRELTEAQDALYKIASDASPTLPEPRA